MDPSIDTSRYRGYERTTSRGAPADPSFYAFSFTRPSESTTPSFVISGSGEEREASVRINYDRFGGFFVKRRVHSGNPNGDWYCDLDALRAPTGRAVFVGKPSYRPFYRL